MFDISVFANPAKLRRDFLATTEIAPQKMGEELQSEFDHIQEENPDILMTGNFWWDYVRTYKKHLSTLLVGRVIMTFLVLASVIASERLLDGENTLDAAIGFFLFYVFVQIVLKLVNAWNARYQSQLFVNTRTFVTLRVNVKLLRMGQIMSNEFSTGNLKTLLSSDVYRIGELFHALSRNGLPCLLAIIILGPVIVFKMGWPGVIAMVVGFGALPLAFLLGKYVHAKEALIKAEEDALSTTIGEWVINVRLLRFLGWEALMRTRIAAHIRSLVVEATKQHGVNLINFGVSVTWWLFPIIALIWSNEVLGGETDVVTLFASIWMLNHITLYIRWLPDIFISYASASACVDRLNRLFLHKEIADDWLSPTDTVTKFDKPIAVHFREVSFSYGDGKKQAIQNLDLILRLDEFVSLVGSVGAGKSTFLKLLCAELKPTSGEILLEFDDGVFANLWHENVYKLYRKFIGYMPQEAYLSNTSLAVNVSLDTRHSEEDVMRALRMAELEADIGQFEHGLVEEIGETGVNLSGGQKQRVNLARALYSNRPYLVMDDPLSAVDTGTEARLMETLLSVPKGFVLSSHRLNELIKTDRVLVLAEGNIIEDGDPTDLINNRNSEFSRQLRAGEEAEPLAEGETNGT